jgi:hypothetical protein
MLVEDLDWLYESKIPEIMAKKLEQKLKEVEL